MKTKHFLKALDEAQIVEALRVAENRTSGEIRVFVSSRKRPGDPVLERAARRFEKLGMTKTRERNGVLLYFVPESREFAIFGDKAVHEKSGDVLWAGVAAGLQRGMAAGDFTAAILGAVAAVGEALARDFPHRPDDDDELSNAVGQD